jgi:hypothetical protein
MMHIATNHNESCCHCCARKLMMLNCWARIDFGFQLWHTNVKEMESQITNAMDVEEQHTTLRNIMIISSIARRLLHGRWKFEEDE